MGPTGQVSSLSGIAAGKVGEGAGRPGLARCCCRVTVSTKPDLGRPSDPPVKPRSGRDGAAPRSRFPRAGRLAALASGLTGGPARPCGRSGRRNVLTLSVAVPSPGARRANRGHPSTSMRTPGLSSARASSLDHSPPTSRSVDPTPSPPTGWGNYGAGSSCGGQIAGFFCEFVKDHMFNMTKSSVSQGIPSPQTPCIPAKAGTQALASPQVSDRAPVSSASLAVAQTWVPAFAVMHGWGRGLCGACAQAPGIGCTRSEGCGCCSGRNVGSRPKADLAYRA